MKNLILFALIIAGCSQATNVKKNISLDKLIDLHNEARSKWEYKELKENQILKTFAARHAEFMLRRNKLTHSDIKDVISSGFDKAGENIAWNQQTEDEVINSWLWSPGHRSNILNKEYDSIGCGVAFDEKNIYWCVIFGKKSKPNYLR